MELPMKEQDKTAAAPAKEYGSTGFIAKWTILVVCALVVAFLGRLFGFEGSPLPFHTSVFALLTGALALICIVGGLYLAVKGASVGRAITKRNGVMLVVFGVFMLGGFFVFKSVVALVFG